MALGAMKEVGLSTSDALDWLGKTFDLSKAYKQLAVLPEHQLHAVVGVRGSFTKHITSIGFTGSVYGFVCVSQALWLCCQSS